ncbi:MAG: TetR/AcrR family transcriptional regulator [Magnetovibrio sp.]|nr:TetR/AcrR family transcriptional regulator [Magnetovibrio sp.]
MAVQKTDEEGVINEALLLLRSKGYHGTTMNDVGKACGLLKGSLYHYFASKEDLAQAVLRHVDRYFQDEVFPIGKDKSRTPQQRLESLSQITLDYFIGRRDGCLMGNIALEAINTTPTFRPIIQKYFKDWAETYELIYGELGLSAKQAKAKSLQAVSTIQGTLMMVRIFDDPSLLKSTIKQLAHPPQPS